MRVLHAAALTIAALFLASITSAQGLGAAAAREKERRASEPAKPVKVYTDKDVATAAPDAPTPAAGDAKSGDGKTGDAKAGDGKTGDGKTGDAKAAPTEEEKAAEAKAKAETDWRGRLDEARKNAAQLTDFIARLNAELGDLSAVTYGPGRAAKMNRLEELKQQLAQTQTTIAGLEEEGRRNGYR